MNYEFVFCVDNRLRGTIVSGTNNKEAMRHYLVSPYKLPVVILSVTEVSE